MYGKYTGTSRQIDQFSMQLQHEKNMPCTNTCWVADSLICSLRNPDKEHLAEHAMLDLLQVPEARELQSLKSRDMDDEDFQMASMYVQAAHHNRESSHRPTRKRSWEDEEDVDSPPPQKRMAFSHGQVTCSPQPASANQDCRSRCLRPNLKSSTKWFRPGRHHWKDKL